MNREDETIKIEAAQNMDCLQSCLNLISGENAYVAHMPMLTCWGFYYEQGKDRIGTRITSPAGMLVNKFLEKYLSVHVEFYHRNYEQDIMVIRNALAKNKIIVGIDAFECSWNIAYQKSHISHFIVLDALQDDKVFCYDPYISKKRYVMDMEQFKKCYYNVRIFPEDISDKKAAIDLQEIYRLLLHGYSKTEPVGIAQGFQAFAQELQYVEEFSAIYEFEDVRLCELIRKLRILYGVRLSIAYILSCLENDLKLTGMDNLYMDFFQMAGMLQMINVQLMKLNLLGNVTPERLEAMTEMASRLGELEEETYYRIKKKLEDK